MTKDQAYLLIVLLSLLLGIALGGVLRLSDRLDNLIDLCTFPETEETLEVEDEPVVDLYFEMES